jgi:stress-induced-phosphoprotein 1
MEVDVGRTNAKEIEQQQQKALAAMYASRENETEEQTKERIQRDPEVSASWMNYLTVYD